MLLSGMDVFFGEMMEDKQEIIRNRSTSDLVIVGFMTIVTSIIGVNLRHEKLTELFLIHRLWGLDEILLIGAFSAAVCAIWYSWRRVQEIQRSEELIKMSEAKYRSLVDSVNDSIYVVDRDCRYLFINNIHLARLGIEERQIQERRYGDFHSIDDSEWFSKKVNKVFQTREPAQHEYRNGHRYFLQSFSPIQNQNNETTAVTVVSKEITSYKLAEKNLRDLSITDELTGLYNRRGFVELARQQLRLARREGRGLRLLYVDVDGLKIINDRHGHKTGDLALNNTASALLRTFRKSDIIARFGGDEFVILAEESPETDFERLTSRLQMNLNAFNLSLSLGMARYNPDQPTSLDQLLFKADALMYDEKKKKKGACLDMQRKAFREYPHKVSMKR